MPLSEEELRLLEQMERALVQEDPKLASTLRGTSFRQSARRRAILAGIGFAAGVAVLIAGAYLTITPLGIAGFVIMLGSATMALTALRGTGSTAASESGPAEPAGRGGFTLIEGGRARRRTTRARQQDTSGSFMERMEARWRRRRDERGGS
ncbi:MAG: DUF3040 domain-containing protein [Nocardioides sp.]